MAEEKKSAADEKKTPTSRSSAATRSSASKVEKEAEKESNFAFPGTGDDTPDTEAAEKRRIEAAEAAQSAIAGRDQELDPEANRDRVRNLDDSTGSSATALGESAENIDGYIDTNRMMVQVSQFDESAPNVVNHLAYPSKHLIEAQKAPSGRRAEIEALGEEDRRAHVGSAARRAAAARKEGGKSSSSDKADDKK